MNKFEKAVIGVARADQAARKVQNTMAMVQFAVFGVIVLGIGVAIYTMKRKDEKQKKLAIEVAGLLGVSESPELYGVVRTQAVEVLEALKANPKNTAIIVIPPAIKTKYAGQTIFNNLSI